MWAWTASTFLVWPQAGLGAGEVSARMMGVADDYAKAVVHSCKSVQPFSRNVADKEISIAASRGFSELTQNVMRSSRSHATPSVKISYKSVQPFCQNKPFSRNVADKEISIAASRGFS